MTPSDIHAERILVLDFGSEYTQLIARQVRSAGVYCEVHPFDHDAAAVQAFNAKGVILSCDPAAEPLVADPRPDAAVYQLGVPVLSIGYEHAALPASAKRSSAYDDASTPPIRWPSRRTLVPTRSATEKSLIGRDGMILSTTGSPTPADE